MQILFKFTANFALYTSSQTRGIIPLCLNILNCLKISETYRIYQTTTIYLNIRYIETNYFGFSYSPFASQARLAKIKQRLHFSISRPMSIKCFFLFFPNSLNIAY